MDAEHRHHLHENELEKLTERVRPVLEQYANTILIAAGAAILVIAVVLYAVRASTASTAAGWEELNSVLSNSQPTASEFQAIAESNAGSATGVWAKLGAAEAFLNSGAALLFTDRAGALDSLEDAEEIFESLVNSSIPDPARERALLGLARTLEASSDGDLNPAIDYYQQYLDEYEDSIFAESIERHIAGLQKKSAHEFYAWFAAQNPSPPDLEIPQDGPVIPGLGNLTPPKTEGEEVEVSESVEIEFPEVPAKSEEPKADTPNVEFPEPEANTATEGDTPATDE
ncbi:tetratricopeptide repeat protein [Calycomorphotria hydatis]|uniref:Tetratricopeptide repeat-like domain-containing protein n=1 Tax=Calycomorphotria hydatis TaxID=2528027 RepID=A0A517TBE5_9PLAN|nr:hypothetical protein [Calycomorphotria hydatis]QDT65694.1 hypothetical protein V22_29540 [Calycomorphotria hydatis]